MQMASSMAPLNFLGQGKNLGINDLFSHIMPLALAFTLGGVDGVMNVIIALFRSR